MCIIVAHETGIIPDMETLKECQVRNRDGIGIAWRGSRGIEFRRGINIDKVWRVLQQVQRDKAAYVLHFRFATQGSKVDPALTHPFPISTKPAELRELRGVCSRVFAHNGTWSGWREDSMAKQCGFLDKGSDSMYMAWLAAKGYFFKEKDLKYWHKLAFLSMKDGLKLQGNWTKDDKTGINYSNSGYKVYKPTKPLTGRGGVWDWDDEGSEGGYWTYEKGVQSWHPLASRRRGRQHLTVPVVHADSCQCLACKDKRHKAIIGQSLGLHAAGCMCTWCKSKTVEAARKVVSGITAPPQGSYVMKADPQTGGTHMCYGEYCDYCSPPERPVADGRTNFQIYCDKCMMTHYRLYDCAQDKCLACKKQHGKLYPCFVAIQQEVAAIKAAEADDDVCKLPEADSAPILADGFKRPPQPYRSTDCSAKQHDRCAIPSQCNCGCGHKKHYAARQAERDAIKTENAALVRETNKRSRIAQTQDPRVHSRGSYLDGPGRGALTPILPSEDEPSLLDLAHSAITGGAKSDVKA